MSITDYQQVWRDLQRIVFVPLTQGKFAAIDVEDLPRVSQHKWNCCRLGKSKNWYAQANINDRNLTLHRFLLDDPSDSQVDHKNRQTLDYRRSNLRPASCLQNAVNRAGWGKTGFKGVRKLKGRPGFRAIISGRYIGRFDSVIEAARAYDVAAVKEWGEFAYVNFPELRAIA